MLTLRSCFDFVLLAVCRSIHYGCLAVVAGSHVSEHPNKCSGHGSVNKCCGHGCVKKCSGRGPMNKDSGHEHRQ